MAPEKSDYVTRDKCDSRHGASKWLIGATLVLVGLSSGTATTAWIAANGACRDVAVESKRVDGVEALLTQRLVAIERSQAAMAEKQDKMMETLLAIKRNGGGK